MKKVKIKISPDGKTQIENIWGYGQACGNLSDALEKALGQAEESTREKTPEYDVEVDNSQSVGL